MNRDKSRRTMDLYMQGFTVEELAYKFNATPNQIRSRLNYARNERKRTQTRGKKAYDL